MASSAATCEFTSDGGTAARISHGRRNAMLTQPRGCTKRDQSVSTQSNGDPHRRDARGPSTLTAPRLSAFGCAEFMRAEEKVQWRRQNPSLWDKRVADEAREMELFIKNRQRKITGSLLLLMLLLLLFEWEGSLGDLPNSRCACCRDRLGVWLWLRSQPLKLWGNSEASWLAGRVCVRVRVQALARLYT